ncbi:Zinc finger GRF-type [Arabidopsis thaliana x Arabidopsis arenosa]|uniref:Zinc finger GRF-type n=1 Tax=Arabidopsis thaliana x Arabidopsis arenosa TaxID=1240361 RepID=A0A8T1ZH62_9BRAS|nr:Zinc finger GRF-type [Arabidopsis thaliana x Arabidopsis arenosa]
MSLKSTSASSSTGRDRAKGKAPTDGGHFCECGKEVMISQSWTDNNPGRRFYRCGAGRRSVCDYFRWRDVERQTRWQKLALIEARDVIRAQSEEINRLTSGQANQRGRADEVNDDELSGVVQKLEEENEALRIAVTVAAEKERRLRCVAILSWIGFVCGVATIVYKFK